jgi:hypothetical protein
VVNVPAPEGGDQNGSIEELFHPVFHLGTLFGHWFSNGAVAIFAFAVDKIDDGGVRRFSLVDPDTEFLFEHDVLADGTESDAFAFRFQMESVAGSELQAVTKGLGQNDAAGFVESKLGSHNGIMEWEKPIVSNSLASAFRDDANVWIEPVQIGAHGVPAARVPLDDSRRRKLVGRRDMFVIKKHRNV